MSAAGRSAVPSDRVHPDPVRVLVVDDHPVIRGVVRMACEANGQMRLVAEASSVDEASVACARARPDVLVVNAGLPGGGVAAIRRLRGEGFDGRVLVLAGDTGAGTVFEALRAGVDGYLPMSRGLHEVGSSILRVAYGERLIDADLERAALGELGRFARVAREGSEVASSLTRREREVLDLLSEGSTMSSVARRLGISPRTVESHAGKLYRKLGVRTRVQAVARGAQLGLIDLR
jgi:DNA-binding NarL/FixJ family response regulator